MTQLLLYLPVIHAGYEAFLDKHLAPDPANTELLLVGRSFAARHPVIRKDIRALDPASALRYLQASGRAPRARIVEDGDLPAALSGAPLVVPDEAVMRDLVADLDLAAHAPITWVATFLSWDREWSRAGRPPAWDGAVTAGEYARLMQSIAADQAGRSSDWWRRVGAVAARDGVVLAAEHNRHLPTEYSPYLDGDPRNSFTRGVAMDATTALHAEAAVVARAARDGVSLAGADLHVTTFPCPACARLVAEAGFARCFFAGGYSVLAGEDVLRGAGVELIWVDLGDDAPDTEPPATPGVS